MSELSVCICTYNRAPLLAGALESFAKAMPPASGRWELLLVDNNSSDHTPEVAARYAADLPLRYVKETNQGLSHARNRACTECRGELLVFTDDDVRVDRGWMGAFVEAGRRFTDADFFGGRLLPDWRLGRPGWLHDEDLALLSGLIVKYDLGEQTRYLEATDQSPFGASFAIRRRLFEKMAPFRIDLGVVGKVPGRGEEAEYMERARAEGIPGVYVAEAVSHHIVDPRRFRLGFLYRFGVEKGVAAARIGQAAHGKRGASVRAVRFLLKGLLQLLKGRGDRFRQCVINMGIEGGLKREVRKAGSS